LAPGYCNRGFEVSKEFLQGGGRHGTASAELPADPGPDLADDGIFVHLAAEVEKGREVGDRQAWKRPAHGALGVTAIGAQEIAADRLALGPPNLGKFSLA